MLCLHYLTCSVYLSVSAPKLRNTYFSGCCLPGENAQDCEYGFTQMLSCYPGRPPPPPPRRLSVNRFRPLRLLSSCSVVLHSIGSGSKEVCVDPSQYLRQHLEELMFSSEATDCCCLLWNATALSIGFRRHHQLMLIEGRSLCNTRDSMKFKGQLKCFDILLVLLAILC